MTLVVIGLMCAGTLAYVLWPIVADRPHPPGELPLEQLQPPPREP